MNVRKTKGSMKFPLVRGDKNSFPRKAVCPQCKKRKVFEPHSMVILGGGALLMDRNRENSIHSDSLEGFLSLGVRKDIIYLPHGLIVMSYLRSVWDRTSLASYGFMSFFDRRIPFS